MTWQFSVLISVPRWVIEIRKKEIADKGGEEFKVTA
jgi:hypothetical protein